MRMNTRISTGDYSLFDENYFPLLTIKFISFLQNDRKVLVE